MFPTLKQIHWDSIMDVVNRKSPSLIEAKQKRIQEALALMDEQEFELEEKYEDASHDEMASLDKILETLQNLRDIYELALSDPFSSPDDDHLGWTDCDSDDSG